VHHVAQNVPDDVKEWQRGQRRQFLDPGLLVRGTRLRPSVIIVPFSTVDKCSVIPRGRWRPYFDRASRYTNGTSSNASRTLEPAPGSHQSS
jgi:hypothetical protein